MLRSFLQSVALCISFLGSFSLLTAQTSTAPTVVSIGTTVQQTGAKRIGINLGSQQYFDSRQIMNNLVFRNPGFEGEMWQSIIHCMAVTATSCTDDKASTVWPANFLQGATVEEIAGSEVGAKAAVASSLAAVYSAGRGVELDFSSAMNPAVGDYLVVRMTVPGNAQAGWSAGVSGAGAVSTEFVDLSPNTVGKQAVRLTAPATTSSAGVTSYFDSSGTHSFVQLNGTYTLTFRAKMVAGVKPLYVGISRLGGQAYVGTFPALTNQWQDLSISFTANEVGALGTVKVAFNVSGGTVLLDDVSLSKAQKSTNPTVFRDEVVDTLRALNPGEIRYMDNGTDWGSTIDNMLVPAMARERAGYSDWNTESDDIPIGLHEFMVLCQTVGAEPWFTMPVGMSVTEMQNLMDYLGGSSSTAYGARRVAMGQATPWTKVFSHIHLEYGNEVWNTANPGSTMTSAAAYGARAGQLFTAAKASASYAPTVIDLVIDGWEYAGAWTKPVLAAASNYDTISQAAYFFGPFVDSSSTEAVFGAMFAIPEQTNSTPGGLLTTRVAEASSAKVPARTAIYEANIGTINGTVDQGSLNTAIPSLGAGLTSALNLLTLMRDQDVMDTNMFTLAQFGVSFQNTKTGVNQQTPIYGAVVDMGGPTNLRRPSFLAQQLANHAIRPVILGAAQSGNNPTWNQPANNGVAAQSGMHYIQSFAFTDGTTNSLILFNLSRTMALPVTFAGSNAPRGSVAVSTLTSAAITDNNETSNTVQIAESTISDLQPSTGITLPPYSMTVLTSAAPSIAALAISCSPTAMQTNAKAQCTSTITGNGTFSANVKWSSTSGTITSGGLYTAPATLPASGEATITATSVQDSTKTASEVLALAIPVSGVTVTCATAAMQLSATNACQAVVSGTEPFSKSVVWTATGGTVDQNGLVTSGTAKATILVKAASVQDATKFATYTITANATPIFSNLVVTPVSSTSVTLTWQSNVPVQQGVNYGPNYATTVYSAAEPYTTKPSVTLTGLTPNTSYKYLAFGYSTTRVYGSQMGSFTTTANGVSISGVSVTCAATTVPLSATVACQAAVSGSGASSYPVTWSATGGTVDQTGVVTAPATAGTIVVKATSTQDSTKSASITITSVAPTVASVAISCGATTLLAGKSVTCTPTVTGTGKFSSAVTWSATAGTISAAGVYTAPASATASQTAVITAASVQDPTKKAALSLSITSANAISGVTVTCTAPVISTKGSVACQPAVTGAGTFSSAVVWSVSSGTVTQAGVVTASANAGAIVVKATSVQDSTKSGSFTVTAAQPIFSAVKATAVSPTSILVTWTSNIPIQAGVNYGPGYSTSVYNGAQPYTTTPSITLTGVSSNAAYQYVIFGYSTGRVYGSQVGNYVPGK